MGPSVESCRRIQIPVGPRSRKRRLYRRLLLSRINNVVINLSAVRLTFSEINVLNRGLGFVPSFVRYNSNVLQSEVDRFERKLQLFYHFKRTSTSDPEDLCTPVEESVFRPTSTWLPKKLNTHISEFCQHLHKKVGSLLKKHPRPNLPQQEVVALKNLRSRKDLTIKPADKGGGICVMQTDDYFSKVCAMLDDTTTYTPVDHSDHVEVKEQADHLLLLLHNRGYISDKQLKYLTDFQPRCPIFYGLPKVHKLNVPLRPIVSQISAPTCMVNSLVDKLLTVAEKMVPNLFQDTTAFLNLLEKHNTIIPGTLLVTMDVASLYTNIPHDEGIAFVAEFYEETLDHWHSFYPGLPPIPTGDLIILMQFILNNCTFQFSDQFFRQKFGTTMGARFSVKFANIYMHMWFTKYLSTYDDICFDFIGRLIDDVFTIWPYGKERFDKLLTFLNGCHPSIKFEADCSTTEVHFLDTVITIVGDRLHTRVYTKPTDKKQFLFYSSCHPLHVRNAIPYSQAIRYRRNTDDEHQLHQDFQTLATQFRQRGYPKDLIQEAIQKASSLDRLQTLHYTSKTQKRANFMALLGDRSFLPFITTFFDQFNHNTLKLAVKNCWSNFMAADPLIKQVFDGEFPLVVFKRGRTISNFLTSTKYIPPTAPLNNTADILNDLLADNDVLPAVTRCRHPRCSCCSSILEISSFSSSDGTQIHAISDSFTCNSKCIIYVIQCSKCSKQYVGQTDRLLKDRLNNHRSDVRLLKPTAVGLHFNLPGHSFVNLSIFPIQDLSLIAPSDRLRVEQRWIHILNTRYPFGINHNPLAQF